MATNQIRPIGLSLNNVTNTAQQVVNEWAEEDLLVGIPAEVVGVDEYESKQVIDVVPLINDVYPDGVTVPAVLIKSVFVKLPSGGGFDICIPVEVGDKVTLHYSHRVISSYLDGNGSGVDMLLSAANSRDCWATHGFGTRITHQNPSQTNFIIKAPNSTITITTEGKITILTEDEAYLQASKYVVDTDMEVTGTLKVSGDVTHESDVNTTGTTTSGSVSADSIDGGTIEATSSLTVGGAEVLGHDHEGQVPPFQ